MNRYFAITGVLVLGLSTGKSLRADETLSMPSVELEQKQEIAEAVQNILRQTNHPELPDGEIEFHLHVKGSESWSWADIKNNGQIPRNTELNPWNERNSI